MPACDITIATRLYHEDATAPTTVSMAANVGHDTCAGVAAANTAAKKAIDFGLTMLVRKPCTKAWRNPVFSAGEMRPASAIGAAPACALRIRLPPNQIRYAAPAIFASRAAQGNVANTIPTPRMAHVAQNKLTTMPATIANAAARVDDTALCTTATKFGPGIMTPVI